MNAPHPDDSPAPCPTCCGEGWLDYWSGLGHEPVRDDCDECGGSGVADDEGEDGECAS